MPDEPEAEEEEEEDDLRERLLLSVLWMFATSFALAADKDRTLLLCCQMRCEMREPFGQHGLGRRWQDDRALGSAGGIGRTGAIGVLLRN